MKWLWSIAAVLGFFVGVGGAGGCASPGLRAPSSELDASRVDLSEISPALRQSRGSVSSRKIASAANQAQLEDFLVTQACQAFRSGLTEVSRVQGVKVADSEKSELKFDQLYRIRNAEWEMVSIQDRPMLENETCFLKTKSIDSRDKTLTRRWKKYVDQGAMPITEGLSFPIQGCIEEQEVSGSNLLDANFWTGIYLENPFIDWMVCSGRAGETLTVSGFEAATGIALIFNELPEPEHEPAAHEPAENQ